MECHDCIPFSELHQFTCRLCDSCLNNVHHVFTYRYILNVEGFEVLVPFAFALVIHFPQQIRDLISHHAATPYVGVDEQGTFGGTNHILERRVHIDEPPVTSHGQPDQSRTTAGSVVSTGVGMMPWGTSMVILGPNPYLSPPRSLNHPMSTANLALT